MRLSRNELIAKLSLGEDNLLGCKEVRFCGASVRGPSPSDLADELAAFANSTIIILAVTVSGLSLLA